MTDLTFELKIYHDGKATIPAWVRKRLDLKEGDVLKVRTEEVYR